MKVQVVEFCNIWLTIVTSKSNLINLQFNLPTCSLQEYLKMFHTTNLKENLF